MPRVMSDTEIRHRKKIQGGISRTTSTLGLTGVGLLAASTKPGRAALRKVPALSRKVAPEIKAGEVNRLQHAATNVSVASGGVGAAGGYNFAAYTSAESKKKKGPVVKNDPFSISKVGDWKTIDQREQSQRRSRKTMRQAGAAAGVGAGLATIGYHDGDKTAYKAGAKTLGQVRDWRTMRNGLDNLTGAASASRRKNTNIRTAKAVGQTAKSTFHSLSGSGKVGTALVGGAAVVGGAAKGKHTYDQHKINQRRRANFRKAYDPEGNRMNRAKKYSEAAPIASGALGAAAAGKAVKEVRHSNAIKGVTGARLVRAKGVAGVAALGAGSVAAYKGGKKIKQESTSGSWQPYVSKSANASAFGVVHD